MNVLHISYYKNNGIELILGSYDGKLCLADSINRKNKDTIYNKIKKHLDVEFVEKEDKLLTQTKKQFDEYYKGIRKSFDIPLLLIGTDFQKEVWQTLLKLPFGETITYKQQAKLLGDEKKVRAVANANGANPLSIIVPCHRVIGSNGKLTGYAGGLEMKEMLLKLEKSK